MFSTRTYNNRQKGLIGLTQGQAQTNENVQILMLIIWHPEGPKSPKHGRAVQEKKDATIERKSGQRRRQKRVIRKMGCRGGREKEQW